MDDSKLITDADYVWWEGPKKGAPDENAYIETCRANSLMEHMRSLEESHREIHRQNLFNYQLYSNRFLASFDWGTGLLTAASLAPVSQTTDNIVLEICDAGMSEIGKARPKAKPICHGASWKTRQNARKLDKFLYGEFIRNRVYDDVGKSALLNAEVCSFGAILVEMEETPQGPKAKYTSVFPDDLLIDQQEVVATKKIWHIIHRQVLPAEVVAATWGISLEEAKESAETFNQYLSYRPKDKDFVVVGTAWRIAADGVPGRRVVAIKDRILEDTVWEHEWVPFVFLHWQRPLQGFYSASLVEQVLPDQVRLNELNDVIEEAQNIMCGPRVFAQKGSQLNPVALDNIIGKVVYYTGQMPEAQTWPAVSAELYTERERLRQNAFAKVGLNQAAAGGNAPANARFDSSPALREWSAVQDNRLADITQRYERMFLDLAEMTIKVIKASGTNPTTVWYSGGVRSRAEKIKWDDIDLEEDSYTMILEAASSFAMTPSAIRDDLEAKLARGEISPEQYQKQLRSPDPDNELSILSAAAENLDFTQERLENGERVPVDPAQDLASGIERMTLAYLNLDQYEDVPVEVREAFLEWIEEAKMWAQRGSETDPMMQAAPPAAPAPMQMAPPMGAPGPMPGMGM
jgi:hypothetical protein